MTQLQYSTGSFRVSRARTTHTPQQRAVGLAFAVAMEASIIYALLVTLGWVEAPKIMPPMSLVNVAPLPKTPDTPPPPPQIFDPPPVAAPIVPLVELTYAPPVPPTAISAPPPQTVAPSVPRVIAPPTPPVIFTPARAIAASHSIPEYPFVSRRLREQGTLRLKLMLDEKGLVTDAIVVNSSGFQRLDEAAVKWVKAQWRYIPAMQGTKPVASTAAAIVEFKLQ